MSTILSVNQAGAQSDNENVFTEIE